MPSDDLKIADQLYAELFTDLPFSTITQLYSYYRHVKTTGAKEGFSFPLPTTRGAYDCRGSTSVFRTKLLQSGVETVAVDTDLHGAAMKGGEASTLFIDFGKSSGPGLYKTWVEREALPLMLLASLTFIASAAPSPDASISLNHVQTATHLKARQRGGDDNKTRRGDDDDDEKDGSRINATLNTVVNLPARNKVDVTYADGFEIDFNSTTANTVVSAEELGHSRFTQLHRFFLASLTILQIFRQRVTSGSPSVTTAPAGWKPLLQNSWKVTYGTPVPTSAQIKIEIQVNAASVRAMGAKVEDTRMAFLANGLWLVDDANTSFDDDENKAEYTGPAVRANNEWAILVRSNSSGSGSGNNTGSGAAGSTSTSSSAYHGDPRSVLGLAVLAAVSLMLA
ncbi:hypothetical protein HK104_000943 [Borealophlyctis nickersoniae]|nr:hypothetical protein HK104_000943 [Borealophlyctis nickersoniae]